MCNATGLRLQTLDGLDGDSDPANAYGTSRSQQVHMFPLDPGLGTPDVNVYGF